jgi:photosystem II stability/assembly factor-like uncharacterized protein
MTNMTRLALSALLSALLIGLGVVRAPAAGWEATAADLLKAEKPGFGGLCGLAVNHETGDVFLDLSDKGLYRSCDQGQTWKKHGPEVKGRTEWPGCLALDPTGTSRGMVLATVYGGPAGVSDDAGASWRWLGQQSGHVDWCALAWAGGHRRFVLALRHESGGELIASRDGGKSFAVVGKGYGPAWVFDDQTAVVAQMRTKERPKPHLLRTTDGGRTFQEVGEGTATALPRWRDGTLYWLVDGALLATTDAGKSWKKLSGLAGGRYGPVFGRDTRHMFVLTGDGIAESRDGGSTWGKALALPKELKGVSPLTWLDYDPKNDVLYVLKMGSGLYRQRRGR